MAWVRGEQRNPAEPEEGYYALKLVKKGPEVGAEIMTAIIDKVVWWSCLINGDEQVPPGPDPELHEAVQKIWLFGRKIDKAEYDFLLARYFHYKLLMPDHPYANPEKPIDDTARRLMGPQED